MTSAARKPSSGEHPRVIAFRAKLESVSENTMPTLIALNDRIERLKMRESSEYPIDSRREPNEDSRQEDVIPVDMVELGTESDPFPAPATKKKKDKP